MDFTEEELQRLSELAGLARARELAHELRDLAAACQDWRAGQIDALELDAFVHDYVGGDSRTIRARYSELEPETAVARAAALRLVEESEIPEGLREKLGPSIQDLRGILDVDDRAERGDEEDASEESSPDAGELAAIRRRRDLWIAAINEGTPAGFVEVLSEDAVWLPAGHDAIRGKEEIQAWLEEPFARFDYQYSVSDVRIRVAGDGAVERGRFSTRGRTTSGDAMPPHEGRYTLIWRKTPEGAWSIERYIDHSADFEPG